MLRPNHPSGRNYLPTIYCLPHSDVRNGSGKPHLMFILIIPFLSSIIHLENDVVSYRHVLIVQLLLGCHGPLANRQPGKAFLSAVAAEASYNLSAGGWWKLWWCNHFQLSRFSRYQLSFVVHYVHFFSIRFSLNLFCVLWWQPLFLRLTCLCRRLVWCLIGFSFPRSGRIYPVWWVYFVMKSSIQSHIMVWARTSTEYVAGYGFPSVASWSSVCLSSSWRSSCGWLLARRKHGVLIVGYGEQNLWK